jgi:hypothetical protein
MRAYNFDPKLCHRGSDLLNFIPKLGHGGLDRLNFIPKLYGPRQFYFEIILERTILIQNYVIVGRTSSILYQNYMDQDNFDPKLYRWGWRASI